MKKRLFTLLFPAAAIALLGSGCIRTTHEIKPIHITMDINLKVDRALDDFFSDVDEAPAAPTAPAAPVEATTPSADTPAKEGN
jgi:hypothetical protein